MLARTQVIDSRVNLGASDHQSFLTQNAYLLLRIFPKTCNEKGWYKEHLTGVRADSTSENPWQTPLRISFRYKYFGKYGFSCPVTASNPAKYSDWVYSSLCDARTAIEKSFRHGRVWDR